MDGYELVQSLWETRCNIPVLMVTAKDVFNDMHTGVLSGSGVFMIKPANIPETVPRVQAGHRQYST